METSYERTTSTKTYNVTHSAPVHSIIISRTGSSGYGTSGSSGGKTVTRSYQSGGGGDVPTFDEGKYAMVTATGVNAVKDARESERKDMQDLNDRFSNYIDKVP